MEIWSVTLTGNVRSGLKDVSAWRRVAGQLGHDWTAFEQKIRSRLPVTLRATDETSARRQWQMLEGCGVEALVLPDTGRRLWIRRDDQTCGPVSLDFVRHMLACGDWDDRMLGCQQGHNQWQSLGDVAEVSAPPSGPPSHAMPVQGAAVASARHMSLLLPTHEEDPELHAGFWIRVAACLFDDVILLIVLVLLTWLEARMFGVNGLIGKSQPVWIFLVNIGYPWIYFALFESSSWQATPGKRVLGLRVVDSWGARVDFWRATVRFLGKYLSGIILCIGYMMAGWTKRKQALHDMIACCCVVSRRGLEDVANGRSRWSLFNRPTDPEAPSGA